MTATLRDHLAGVLGPGNDDAIAYQQADSVLAVLEQQGILLPTRAASEVPIVNPDEPGHTFVLATTSRLGLRDDETGRQDDADWWGPSTWRLAVRAWSLPAALQIAATARIVAWDGADR